MQFTTHNQQDIDTQGLTSHGTIEASEQELTSLFGKGMLGKPMWRVLFKDGAVAFIYPADSKHYYVEGRDAQAFVNVQITLDLHREKQQTEGSKDDKVQEAFGSVFAMFESLAHTKGIPFTRVVELALHIRKRQELFNQLLGHLVACEEIPKEAAEGLTKVDAMLSAKVVAIATELAKIDAKGKEGAEEIINWTDRIMEAEQTSAKKLFGDLLNKAGADD